jgi:hypothetical protein
MNKEQREKFKRASWKLGTVGELFDLTPAEEALIEAKVRLSKVVRALRQQSLAGVGTARGRSGVTAILVPWRTPSQ